MNGGFELNHRYDGAPKVGRKEAKNNNLTFYWTGKKCPYGHVSYRRLSNGGCVICSNISARKVDNKRLGCADPVKKAAADKVIFDKEIEHLNDGSMFDFLD